MRLGKKSSTNQPSLLYLACTDLLTLKHDARSRDRIAVFCPNGHNRIVNFCRLVIAHIRGIVSNDDFRRRTIARNCERSIIYRRHHTKYT